MSNFSNILIIFNPNSTGDSPKMAHNLRDGIAKRLPDMPVELVETEHAGHAEEIAYAAAGKHDTPLLVSVSGDGGYHELINGAMRAADAGKGKPVCAILPGGNANDHHSSVADRPLLEAIVEGKTSSLDLLKLTSTELTRYAHSYIGLGITPVAAIELNKHDLSALKELWLVVRTFHRYKPFGIRVDGKDLQLDSLVFANIDRMAKVMTLSDQELPDDGKFEVIALPHAAKWRLLMRMAVGVIRPPGDAERTSRYSFNTLKPTPIQLDGELYDIKAGAQVTISSAAGKLATLI